MIPASFHLPTLPIRPRLRFPRLFPALLCAAGVAAAEDVHLTAGDPFGASSFNSAGNWSNLAAPSAGNRYFTRALNLRTPATAGDFTFAGDSLTVEAGGRLLGKGGGSNTTQTITVADLILDGGTLDQAGTNTTTGAVLVVGGNITVTAPSFIGALSLNANNTPNFETLEITGNLTGSEPVTIAGTSNASQNRGVVRLSSANDFSGNLDVVDPGFIASATHRLLQLNHPDALRHATLGLFSPQQNPMSFAAAANTAPFRVAGLEGNAAQALTDTENAPVILEVGGTGQDSFFSGILRGNGSLVKTGDGNLTLQGLNTFTGGLVIEAGSLTLDFDAGLHSGTSVSIAAGATLEIVNEEPVLVASLVLDGDPQPAGTYHAGNAGGFISGSGELVVSDGDPVPQNIPLVANDPFGTSSFNSAGNWSNSEPPSALNHYFTQGFLLRTPNVEGDFVFGGASLTVGPGGRILGKGAGVEGAQQTITVEDLTLDGGSLEQAGNPNPDVVLTVQGAITVTAPSVLGALGADLANDANFETLDIVATISGSEPLQVAGTANNSANRGVVKLSAANPYSGIISIQQPGLITSATHRLLQLNHPDALRHATLSLSTTSPNGLSFAAAANTGVFRIGGLTGTAAQTLADTEENPVTLEVGGNNEPTFFDGILDGPGTLTKTGDATFTYTSDSLAVASIDVAAGTIELYQPALSDASTVTIADGAVLHLAHDETDTVRRLILDGIEQAEGIYDASNTGGRITSTGSGKILVAASSGFTLFMEGFAGLSEADRQPAADPDGDGIPNLLEYALDGFDPTRPDGLPGLVGNTLTFGKRALAVSGGDVDYIIETSTTLGAPPQPWTPVVPDQDDGISISHTLPPGSPRDFMRLRVVMVD